jgi:hypothetical protein
MPRAVLLPTPGDPYLLRYWAANFVTWADRVDGLLVAVNGQNDPEALGYIEALLARLRSPALHVGLSVYPERTDHGVLLGRLLDHCGADTVMLAEEDAYVREPASIDRFFEQVERRDCDVVGSPRGSASMSLIAEGWKRWPGSPPTASCDEGNGLWPCFLFARREDLAATDGHFGARRWERGERIAGLDLVAGVDIDDSVELSCDTFVSTAWQLRASGLRIRHVPQYRVCDPGFLGLWLDHDPQWFHVGSLSSGLGMAFAGGHALIEEGTTGGREWARRICWWRRFLETAPAEVCPGMRDGYAAGLDELAGVTGAEAHVASWQALFEGWVNWDEAW